MTPADERRITTAIRYLGDTFAGVLLLELAKAVAEGKGEQAWERVKEGGKS